MAVASLHHSRGRSCCICLLICISFLLCGSLIVGQQKNPPKTEADTTFDKDGKKVTATTTHKDGTVEVETKYLDGNGKLRRRHVEKTQPSGEKQIETDEYDCNERLVSKEEEDVALNGKWTRKLKEEYKDGKVVKGTLDEDFNGDIKHKTYNDKTERYEETRPGAPEFKLIPIPPCPLPEPNQLTLGPSIIREDSTEPFNTYGFNASLTHYVNSTLGVTGDFNANFRSRNGADLSKFSVLGGVTVLPFKQARISSKATISAHAFFGIAHFKSDSGSVSSTANSFAMKLGGAVDVNVNRRFFIRPIQIDYAPTFFGTNMQNNVQFTFGAGFRF